jgi:hypothetical protein
VIWEREKNRLSVERGGKNRLSYCVVQCWLLSLFFFFQTSHSMWFDPSQKKKQLGETARPNSENPHQYKDGTLGDGEPTEVAPVQMEDGEPTEVAPVQRKWLEDGEPAKIAAAQRKWLEDGEPAKIAAAQS